MTASDIYTRVTNQIVAAIEEGSHTFKMPWHSAVATHAPQNAQSQRRYRAVNTVILWAVATAANYPTGVWATYRQWRDLGAQVRKGEKATEIVLWKECEKKDSREVDSEPDTYLMARGFSVFNAAQVDGYTPEIAPVLPDERRIQTAEAFFSRLKINVRYGGNRAFYSLIHDFVQMPEFAKFRTPGAFYSTLSHETVHWTGAPHRLNRQFGIRFASEEYAAEELVAELGAAFLAARIGAFAGPRGNHAGYIAHWLKLLKSDKRAIFTAASKAQQAVDWLIEQAGSLPIAA